MSIIILGNIRYKIIKYLGKGGYGRVLQVKNKSNNKYYALKEIIIQDEMKDKLNNIKKESEILSKFNSKNIVKYYDSFLDKNKFYILMEYCSGQSLRDLINKHYKNDVLIEEDILYNIVKQICIGIKEIHEKNIIHRDLKPDNIFMDEKMNIKIGDFGISKYFNSDNEVEISKYKAGDFKYTAPEILIQGIYNKKSDMYSLGCIIYELIYLKKYFDDKEYNEIKKIDSNTHNIKWQEILNSLLKKEFDKRMDINELEKEINNINIENNEIINKIKELNINKENLNERIKNIIENNKTIFGNNLSQIINNFNKDQITLLKLAVNFYQENNISQMDFNNPIQISNLINYLFSPDIEFSNKTDVFKYITHDKRRKRIKFIFNSSFRCLMDIPIFFTNKELYSIVEEYKEFHSTNIILIHNNKILKDDESSLDEISNGDKIWIIEDRLYPDNTYYFNLQNKFFGKPKLNIFIEFAEGKENFILSEEVTIHELIRAIVEKKGYAIKDCKFLYNGRAFEQDDKRKIKEVMPSGGRIYCHISGAVRSWILGKQIKAITQYNTAFGVGTLDPIKNLFYSMGEKGKIVIGKIELKYESENYLSFYGINEDFNLIWKDE